MAKKKATKTAKKAVKRVTKKAAKKKVVQKNSHGRASGQTQLSISIPADLIAKVDKLADAENRNRSNYISVVLEERIARG